MERVLPGCGRRSHDDGVVVHPALIKNADRLPCARALKSRDSLVALTALFVDMDVHALHLGQCSHLDASAPIATGHPLGVLRDCVVGVVADPFLDRSIGNCHVRILGDVTTNLSAQGSCVGPVAEAIAQRVEQARAVPRLRYDTRIPNDGCAVAIRVLQFFRLAVRGPSVLVFLSRLSEVRALVRLMGAIALVAAKIHLRRRFRGGRLAPRSVGMARPPRLATPHRGGDCGRTAAAAATDLLGGLLLMRSGRTCGPGAAPGA
mmetsp:Transcript_142801/g.372016  ORF Transcript_142801/g.372016 Transcript_142801/m.372016 type:complete len:262 (+) Transcript_142801:104-889(+)